MKPTGINAPRLTARSIARSFRLSGKRHLLLTGDRGSGKTTLLRQLLPLLSPSPVPGVTTWAEAKRAVYLQENSTGQTVQVGEYSSLLPGHENKMRPLAQGFTTLGLAALERCGQSGSPWFSMDEIGYLECGCGPYCAKILALMEKKRMIAVVRKQELPFLEQLKGREDVFLLDLDAPVAPLGCVVMASGQGKRFGGNKLMADFGGSPMLARVLDATQGLFVHRSVVTRSPDTARFCREWEVPTVFHALPYRSDTVRLGLQAVGGDMAGCLFCPGDQPLLSRETVQTMALAASREPEFIWQLSFGGQVGTPVLFPKWAFAELMDLPAGKGGGVLIKKYPQRVRYVPARDRYELMDVDTPEELKFLLEHLERGRSKDGQ